MKCITHNHVDSVGQCVTCWWGLCKDCIHSFTIPICPSCNLKYWEKRKMEILWLRKKVPFYAVGIGFLILLLGSPNMWNVDNITYLIIWLLYSILGVFIYFWWLWIDGMNKDDVTVRINDTIVAMIMRKVFKLIFAGMIWIFVWPYEIYKLRKEYKQSLSMIEICKAIITKSTNP